MNDTWTAYAPLAGRMCLGGYFLWSGIQEILNLSATGQLFAQVGFSNPLYVAAAATLVETICGIALLTGYKVRMASLALILYTFLATLVIVDTASTSSGARLVLSNLAVIGGLLYAAAFQSGKWSTR